MIIWIEDTGCFLSWAQYTEGSQKVSNGEFTQAGQKGREHSRLGHLIVTVVHKISTETQTVRRFEGS